MKPAVVFFALLGLSYAQFAYAAEETCKFDESTFTTIRTSPRSSDADDAETYSYCSKGETLAGCICEPFPDRPDDCDGSYIASYKDGERCVAKNGAFGKGVQAKAICQKTAITCTSSYTSMPVITCAPNYKLMFCTLHTFYMQKYPEQPIKPRVKRDGPRCMTTAGCENCRVQARCVRVTAFDSGVPK